MQPTGVSYELIVQQKADEERIQKEKEEQIKRLEEDLKKA